MDERFDFIVNGNPVRLGVDEQTPLLTVLRNVLGLRGSRFGCGHEQCGACTVLIDGEPICACSRPIREVAGKTVTTIEGLADGERLHPLQQAILDEQAGQCGYCLSGILMRGKALLDSNPQPTRKDIISALDANLCRCGAHNRIIRAVERAARAMRDGAIA